MNNYTYKAKVIHVVDGDTIDCECYLPFHQTATHRFRLLNIDAPEMRGEEKEEGKKVTEYLRALVEGKICTLTSYKSDNFGRWLCTCKFTLDYADVEIPDLSEHLIQLGYARRYEK